jgi:hypothetical protein
MERMEKQLTAVEWLENRFLQTEGNLYAEDFTKAKEMEKEQICKAYTIGVSPMLSIWRFGEDYYNETFKSE